MIWQLPRNLNVYYQMIKKKELLVDRFSRTISYLRLSITDRCNLSCIYCMPQNDTKNSHLKSTEVLPRHELLRYEELLRIVEICVSMGMNKLRLTGGEPLVRKGAMNFIHQLTEIKGLEDIRLTTNGVLLKKYVQHLHKEGIRNLNISLDTLQRDRYARITGRDCFEDVWSSIHEAVNVGFRVKINVVAMNNVNDDEFVAFAQLAMSIPVQIRFIEFMPLGVKSTWQKKAFISGKDIIKRLAQVGTLKPLSHSRMEGPAKMYSINGKDGQEGRIGVISPISHHFCDQCNRLRLTSEGKLRSCLLYDRETDLKNFIRNGCTDDNIRELIKKTISLKPKGHTLNSSLHVKSAANCSGQMSRIGG